MTQLLLVHGANPNMPLRVLFDYYGDLALARLFARAGADPNAGTTATESTPLHYVAYVNEDTLDCNGELGQVSSIS